MEKPKSLIGQLLVWRSKHISHERFVLLLSIVLGLIGGLTAVALKLAMHYSHELVTGSITEHRANFWYLVLPIGGIMLSVLMVRYLYRGNFAHGITNILYAISQKNSVVSLRDFLFFTVGSFFTVGLGGSVGLEATLLMSGSGIGSNIARAFRLQLPVRILLLGCGSAAALSSFFHAPIAGVIFAMEVLMLDLTMKSLLPLLAASITGTIVSRAFLPNDIIFSFQLQQSFGVENSFFYIALGLLCALISFYFSKVDALVEHFGAKFSHWLAKSLTGAALAGFIIFCFPPLFGEGYGSINLLLHNDANQLLNSSFFYQFKETSWALLVFLLAIIIVKAFAVALTLGSGGIGGYFAPSLFMGGFTGFFFARSVNNISPATDLPEANFTLVGMAGVMAGLFYAPLSAIFLIAEITSGYGLIIPLMIVSTISYLVAHYLEPYSLFTKRLALRGHLVTHDKDKAVIKFLRHKNIIEQDFEQTSPTNTLGEFLEKAVARSKRNIFPVVNNQDRLMGIVLLDDVRPIIFKRELYNKMTVKELMKEPPAVIYIHESTDMVIDKFDKTNAWNLPVIDRDGRYVGFISKSKLLSAYRETLKKFSHE